jgi:hypothetical protein
VIEIDILDAQTQGFHHPQPTAIHKAGHEPIGLAQIAKHGLHLGAIENDRYAA